MKILAKEILLTIVLLQLLAWMLLSALGKPIPGCSQTSEIELYDPTDTGAETICIQCLECPAGQGLSVQCGSRVPNGTKIECILCQVDVSYSDKHGIESCKACQDCDVKNVIQNCTRDQNRKCGTKCPQGYFLDHNAICQECYFCCDSVSEAQRRQECIDIGMTRNWQCEKTEKNQHCKEDFEKVTTKPTDTELTVPPNHNTMTEKHVKTHKFATSLPHQPGKNHILSQSTSTTIQGTRKLPVLPANDDSANAAQSTKQDKGKEEHDAVSLRVVIGVVCIIFVIPALALMTSKHRNQFCQFSRTKHTKVADNREWIPLNSTCKHTDSGRASPQDISTTEVPPWSSVDNALTTEENEESGKEICKPNPAHIPADVLTTEVLPLSPAHNALTTEEHEESGWEVCKPNPADIPAGCRISEMEQLCDKDGNLMLIYIKKKLDALETPNRKTWRSIGQVFQVNADDLNMAEIEYMARGSPTESLLELLKNHKKEPTMREFVQALIICERHDVADFICNWPWAKYFVPISSENLSDMVQ